MSFLRSAHRVNMGAMATKKPNGDMTQGSDQTQKTAPLPLPESEWAFHKVPQESLRYCALWELDRLRGNKQKPWLELTTEERERFVVEVKGSGLQEIPASVGPAVNAAVRRYPHLVEQDESALKVITFLVDFHERENTLRELFRLWLKHSPHREKWRNTKPPTTRWKSLLTQIVILRAKEAGVKRKVAKEKFSDLWKKWGYYGATEGTLSRSHWLRAIDQAEALRKWTHVLSADPPFGAKTEVFEIRLRGMSTFVPVPSKRKAGLRQQ